MKKTMFPRDFIEWKDQYTEYCTNGFSPHFQQYRVDTHGEYLKRFEYLWYNLDDLYKYWRLEIEPKTKEDENNKTISKGM